MAGRSCSAPGRARTRGDASAPTPRGWVNLRQRLSGETPLLRRMRTSTCSSDEMWSAWLRQRSHGTRAYSCACVPPPLPDNETLPSFPSRSRTNKASAIWCQDTLEMGPSPGGRGGGKPPSPHQSPCQLQARAVLGGALCPLLLLPPAATAPLPGTALHFSRGFACSPGGAQKPKLSLRTLFPLRAGPGTQVSLLD